MLIRAFARCGAARARLMILGEAGPAEDRQSGSPNTQALAASLGVADDVRLSGLRPQPVRLDGAGGGACVVVGHEGLPGV